MKYLFKNKKLKLNNSEILLDQNVNVGAENIPIFLMLMVLIFVIMLKGIILG